MGQIRCFTSQLPTSGGGDRQSAIAGRRKWGKSIATPRSCPLRRAGTSSRRWLTGKSGANLMLHIAVAPLHGAGAGGRPWLTGESGANPLLHLAVAPLHGAGTGSRRRPAGKSGENPRLHALRYPLRAAGAGCRQWPTEKSGEKPTIHIGSCASRLFHLTVARFGRKRKPAQIFLMNMSSLSNT